MVVSSLQTAAKIKRRKVVVHDIAGIHNISDTALLSICAALRELPELMEVMPRSLRTMVGLVDSGFSFLELL